MHEIASFFAQCAHSRALITSLCALIVVPPAAALAGRLFAPHILRMTDDPACQAAYAAAAAALPGAVFVVLALGSLASANGASCWTMPGGRFVLGAIVGLTVAAIIHACWRFVARAAGIQRLASSSGPATPRLRELATVCGVRVLEINDAAPVCALAGLISPTVFVSTGALRALNDEELRAALLHERAHIRRGDQIVAACLSFFADLLPLPSTDLLETHRFARELVADRAAAELTGANTLAHALIAFAKSGNAIAGAVSFAEPRPRNVVTRISMLLAEPSPRRAGASARMTRRLALGCALAVLAVISVSFPVLAAAQPSRCAIEVRSVQ